MIVRVIIGNEVVNLTEHLQPGIFIGLTQGSFDVLYSATTGAVATFASTYSQEAREWLRAQGADHAGG